jgi:dTDP-4-dehydrorhamnose 3,5-epimerase
MRFVPTPLHGVFVVELEPRTDERGSFSRAYCRREFADQGIDFTIAQANLAHTDRAGIVRGLHYQEPPAADAKLVRCVAGAVFDVVIDMRTDSPTYRRSFSQRLDPRTRLALFVPGGVAHGYQALEDHTEFLYMTDQFYTPGLEKGVRFDDPALGVHWPLPPREVAQRDRAWPLL